VNSTRYVTAESVGRQKSSPPHYRRVKA